jgi:hypothetical protein
LASVATVLVVLVLAPIALAALGIGIGAVEFAGLFGIAVIAGAFVWKRVADQHATKHG